MEDSLRERGKSLEDAFFREMDRKLLQKLRSELQRKNSTEELQRATGISDPAVLSALSAQNINSDTLVCVALVPLVSVAWADGTVQDHERDAILRAAHDQGIDRDSVAHLLLEDWLKKKPGPDLLECWKNYIHGIRSTVEPAVFGQMKALVLGRANDVAKASGGFLGIGSVSDSEQKVLAQLEKAFA